MGKCTIKIQRITDNEYKKKKLRVLTTRIFIPRFAKVNSVVLKFHIKQNI